MDRRQQVIDFSSSEQEQLDDSEPDPASLDDYLQLRTHAFSILSIINAAEQQSEHIVPLGQDFHLHLFNESDSFGVYNKDPHKIGGVALKAPLITTGMYLRVPSHNRDQKEGYVAGFATKKVSKRSVGRLIELCSGFIESHVGSRQSEDSVKESVEV